MPEALDLDSVGVQLLTVECGARAGGLPEPGVCAAARGGWAGGRWPRRLPGRAPGAAAGAVRRACAGALVPPAAPLYTTRGTLSVTTICGGSGAPPSTLTRLRSLIRIEATEALHAPGDACLATAAALQRGGRRRRPARRPRGRRVRRPAAAAAAAGRVAGGAPAARRGGARAEPAPARVLPEQARGPGLRAG